MKEITLQVNGREMTFSEEELVAILEEHFGDKTSKTEAQTTKGVQTEDKKTKPTKTQAKGKYFDVIPSSIDVSLFKKNRNDEHQEWVRQIIRLAFSEVKKHPEKYAKPFKVMIPEKMWITKTVKELKELAKKLGDHIANWVEWALSLAQRISNGETWEAVCNDPDTEKWYRLIVWKNDLYRRIGGSVNRHNKYSASKVLINDYDDDDTVDDAVPVIVCYEENCPLTDRIAS